MSIVCLNRRMQPLNLRKALTAAFLCLILMVTCAATSLAGAVLGIGSSGSDVTKVQQRLIRWGYLSGGADGAYGQRTADAVSAFQRANGLPVDGKVGPATAAAIGVSISPDSAYVSNDHMLLARLVHAEARGESYLGQVAVAAVALNRVDSADFPGTLRGVIYQKNAFTCVNDGQFNLTPNDSAIHAALEALHGADPTGGCLYYYNPVTAKDPWIRTRETKLQIGNHVFAT